MAIRRLSEIGCAREILYKNGSLCESHGSHRLLDAENPYFIQCQLRPSKGVNRNRKGKHVIHSHYGGYASLVSVITQMTLWNLHHCAMCIEVGNPRQRWIRQIPGIRRQTHTKKRRLWHGSSPELIGENENLGKSCRVFVPTTSARWKLLFYECNRKGVLLQFTATFGWFSCQLASIRLTTGTKKAKWKLWFFPHSKWVSMNLVVGLTNRLREIRNFRWI